MHKEVIRSNFAELETNKYDGYIPVFTGRSCIDGRTGCVVCLPNEVAQYRLLDDGLIFTAELYAIHEALLCIQESTLHDFVIYFDSLSSLELVEQLYPTQHPSIYKCRQISR
jgi:hypothetical protein